MLEKERRDVDVWWWGCWTAADLDVGVVVMGVRKVGLHPNLMTQGASPRVKTRSTQNTPALSHLVFLQPKIALTKYAFTTLRV